jgi:hypothetical protein
MAVGFYVSVPEDLAESLVNDGFRRSGPVRGVADDVFGALAAGANLTTVLVGAHEIGRLARHLWVAARRRTHNDTHVTTVVIEDDRRRVAISLEHQGFEGDEPPEDAVEGMVALIKALAPRSPGRTDNEAGHGGDR